MIRLLIMIIAILLASNYKIYPSETEGHEVGNIIAVHNYGEKGCEIVVACSNNRGTFKGTTQAVKRCEYATNLLKTKKEVVLHYTRGKAKLFPRNESGYEIDNIVE